jgi:hypothetical protein
LRGNQVIASIQNTPMSDSTKTAAPTAAPEKTSKPKAAPPTDDKKPKPKPGPKEPKKQQLRPLQTYTGTVGEFGANPDGVYDRFVLHAADAPARTVRFAPHFGEELRRLAQPYQPVTVLGYLHTTPKGEEHLHLASLDVAGTTAQPAAPDATTVAGTIAELHHDPKGHLTGLRLAEDDTELRLPPHLSQQLAGHLAVGTALTASGRQRRPRPGEVAAHPAPVQVELLTVGGESFLIK